MSDPSSDDEILDPQPYFRRYVPAALVRRREWLSDALGDLRATAQVDVEGDGGGTWHFVIEGGAVSMVEGAAAAADFTVRLSVATFRRLRANHITPATAFVRGKLRVSGHLPTALKLAAVLR